jgi:ribosomal protein L28
MIRCTICGKKSNTANTRTLLRGNYNPTGKRKQRPNLQWTQLDGKRVKACTSCKKAQNKVR